MEPVCPQRQACPSVQEGNTHKGEGSVLIIDFNRKYVVKKSEGKRKGLPKNYRNAFFIADLARGSIT